MSIDQDQFLKILEEHKGILYKVSSHYAKCHDDLQDLVQEITLQIYRSFEKYDPRFKWSTFIYRIALNVAISFYRKSQRIVRHSHISESILQVPDTKHLENSDPEQLALLRKFIDQLNPLEKALMLLYLDGASTAQAADILGISSTNVTSKIHRIKKKLKKRFENY